MARGAVMFASPLVCRFQPLALALLLVACFAGHAYGSCLQYGHSCWGAHGKRSGGQNSGEAALTGDGLLGPLAPASSSSSSSPSSTDSEALWVLSKLMATKALERKDAEGAATEGKDSSIWQRLLEAKKNGKPSDNLQQTGGSPSQSESSFDQAELQNIDNAKKAEEIETKNKLESGERSGSEDGDDLALEDVEDYYPFDEDEDEQGTDGNTRDSRRYRYKLQKHWANRRKNRRPYRHYYYYKRW